LHEPFIRVLHESSDSITHRLATPALRTPTDTVNSSFMFSFQFIFFSKRTPTVGYGYVEMIIFKFNRSFN